MQKEGLSKLYTELYDVIPKSVLTNKNKRKSWEYGFDEKYGMKLSARVRRGDTHDQILVKEFF